MIERAALASLLLLAACREDAPARSNEPAPSKEQTPRAAPVQDDAPSSGPELLWIFPKLSATLRGEPAEPFSQPVTLVLDGRTVRLGVRLREGELVAREEGRRQLVFLELFDLDERPSGETIHRFTLTLAEGPDVEPTDDLLRAETRGDRILVTLARRGLREDEDVLEDEPEVVEQVLLARDASGKLRAVSRSKRR